jgi:hypothetical protein
MLSHVTFTWTRQWRENELNGNLNTFTAYAIISQTVGDKLLRSPCAF